MKAAARSLRAHPCRWLLAAVLAFVAFPGIDLTVSGWFYVPGLGFPMRHDPFGEFVRKGLPPLIIGSAVYAVVLWLAGRALGQRFLGIDGRVAAYLALSLSIGPGLIVNTLLKDHWGRARPSQIVEFGGTAHYTPPLMLSDQCATNCAFASGHGALAYWVIAYALLLPSPWRRWAVAGALAFGTLIGFVRIAQGGHFLSDTVAAAAITVAVTAWLHRWLIGGRRTE